MNIDNLLNEEVAIELERLKEVKPGTEEYKVAVDGVTKLLDRAIEIKKFDAETSEKAKITNIDNGLKLQQMSDERKDRLIKNCIAIGGIVVPTLVTIWGTVKSIEFEKEGTITTIMGRGFINKLLPKK